jgi:hypothetical protein
VSPASADNEAFRRFLRRVWRDDVGPLLRDHREAQRRKSARVAGKAAAAAGLLFDGVFGLKGKPFTRFMTVVGSSFGALLPDVWDWEWLRDSADDDEREFVTARVQQQAARLPEDQALELFELPPTATRDDLKQAWRAVLQRWHPDKARTDAARAEYHLRFLAYKAAYEHLCVAYDEQRLPRAAAPHGNL